MKQLISFLTVWAMCLVSNMPAFAQNNTTKPNAATSQNKNIKIDDKGLVNLDFVNTEIAEIAKTMGELTQRNFIIDDKVRGKVTIISPRAVSVAEAYQAFISALEVKGFTVVKVNKMHKILQLKNVKKLPIEVDVRYPQGGGDAFVTRLIPIKYTQASSLQKSLRNLLSTNGDIFSYDPTNTLIVTDSVVNIRRLLRIIQKLDQQGFQESIHVLELKYATAADTAQKIRELFNLKESKGGAKPPVNLPGGVADDASNFISKIIPDERTNSLIISANEEGMVRIRSFVDQIDKTLEDQINSGRIHVHYLQYADAVELAATLGGVSSSLASKSKRSSSPTGSASSKASMLGGDVEIVADEHTNSLIITASPSDYQSLVPVIGRLDIRRPQAFVEAMIMEVNLSKVSEIGVGTNAITNTGIKGYDTNVFGGTSLGDVSSIGFPTTLSGLLLGVQGKTVSVPIGNGSNIDIPIFGGMFRALQTDGTINVLSTPNILTQDNTEAEIVVGKVIPFISSSGRDVNNQPINQIQRENVALTLRVTPQINSSDELTMDIFQEIQDVDQNGATDFGPTTSTRSAKTTVLIKDGQTVTIGGLISDKVEVTNSKVPILGDAPLIGWLFRNRSKTKTKQSLVMFLTPHIIRTPQDLEDMTIEKNLQRQRFLESNRIKEHPGIKKYKLNKDLRSKRKNKRSAVPQDSPSAGFLPETPYEKAQQSQ